MKGVTSQGTVQKLGVPPMDSVESVPSTGKMRGQTDQGTLSTRKSSITSAFSASRKSGSVRGC